MNNLFIIGTPLQLICAIEAIEYFKLSNNILVLINISKVKNKKQIDEIVKLYKWEKIIEVKNGKGFNFFKYFSLIRGLNKGKYKNIFVAKLDSISMAIVANIKKEKLFLLDDGGTTVTIYNNYIKNNYTISNKFKDFRFLLLGLRIKIKDKINLFTYYDLKQKNGNEVVRHKFEFFKKSYFGEKNKQENVVYFFGQPIVGNFIDEKLHISILKAIIKKYNKKIIYIPHRGEDKETISKLEFIDSTLLEVKNLEMPAELYFLTNKIYPKEIFSYFSAVLKTLEIIYDDCIVHYIEVAENYDNRMYFTDSMREYYEEVSKNKLLQYKDLGIEV